MGKQSLLNSNKINNNTKYQAVWSSSSACSKNKTKNNSSSSTRTTRRSNLTERVLNDEGTAAIASQPRKSNEFERTREENIERNDSFLRSIGIEKKQERRQITTRDQTKKSSKDDLSPIKRRTLRSNHSMKSPPLKSIDESLSRRLYRERISCPYRNLGCYKRVYVLDGSTAAIAFAKHILNGYCCVKRVKFANGNMNEVQIVNLDHDDIDRRGYKPKYYPIGKLDIRSYSPRNDDEFQDHDDLIDEEEGDDIPEEENLILNCLSKLLIAEMPGLTEEQDQVVDECAEENIDKLVYPCSHLHLSIPEFITDEFHKADNNAKENPDTSIIQHQGKWLAVFDTSDIKTALPKRTLSKREDLIDLYACQAQLGLSGKTEGQILLKTISNIVDRNVKTIEDDCNQKLQKLLIELKRKPKCKVVCKTTVHIPLDMRSVRQACTINFDPLNHITVQKYFYPEKFFGRTFKAKQLNPCTGASADIMEVIAYALLNIDPEKINLEATRLSSPATGERIYRAFHTGDLANNVCNHYKNMRGRGEENAYPLFIALQFDTASASTARTRDQCPVSIQILNCPEKQTHLVGFAPIHDAYSDRELREILIRRGCKVINRQKSIIKLFRNQRVNRFLYDIMEPTLLTHEKGVLAQIGRGTKARHVKLYVHVVKIIGDIVALNGCTSTSFQRTKHLTRRCRICMAPNLHGSFDVGELRKNDETDSLSKRLEIILTKQFNCDILDQRNKGKGKYRKTQEEQQVMNRANLLGILAGTNPVLKMFEYLFDLKLHSFHEGIGPDILHVFKLGVLRNIIAWTIEIMETLSKLERSVCGTDKLEHALPLVDGYLKAFPLSKSMQTWHPVRPIRFNYGITHYIRSQTDDGNTTGGYLTTMYGYMYPPLAFQLMFIIANDISGNILPRDTDINDRLLNSQAITKSISSMCLDALAAAVEVHMFLEREEYLDKDLSCLDMLIRNLRVHYTYLFKLRSDLLKLAKRGDDNESDNNDEDDEALDMRDDLESSDDDEEAEAEESPQERQVLFNMKEIKSHYMAHIIADIKLFGGYRTCRDTEDTEFSMKPFLKDLWPVISKRFGTDKKELLRRHFENRHAMDLQRQFVQNEVQKKSRSVSSY